MENWMYKCELCTTARLSVVDKGEVWFIDCGSCRSLQFHHKVIVKLIVYKDLGIGNGNCYYGFECKMDKEEEDGKSEKR
jgi:hypothetical protein